MIAAGVLGALALSLPSARASACGASPDAFWSFGGTLPKNGARDVPTDVALWFEGQAHTIHSADSRAGQELAGLMQVRVREQTTLQEVAGALAGWGLGPRPTALWRPKQPLRANTTYEVYARVDNNVARPFEAPSGGRDLHFSFTTAAEGTAPPSLAEQIKVEREVYDQPVFPCGSICGNPPACAPSHRVSVPHLRVTVPPLATGMAEGGFRATTYLVRGRPGDTGHEAERAGLLAGQHWEAFLFADTNRATSGTIALSDEQKSGPHCVYLVIEDMRGAVLQPAPTCLDSLAPVVMADGGCTVARRSWGSRSTSGPGLGWVVIGLVVVIAQRYRSRRRPARPR